MTSLILWSLLYLWIFWLLYVLVMGFYRAWLDKRLKGVALVLAAPVIVVAYLVDLVGNWTLFSAIFRRWPTRPLDLVTDRLIRELHTGEGWRLRLAQAICDGLLDYFDPTGKHCK